MDEPISEANMIRARLLPEVLQLLAQCTPPDSMERSELVAQLQKILDRFVTERPPESIVDMLAMPAAAEIELGIDAPTSIHDLVGSLPNPAGRTLRIMEMDPFATRAPLEEFLHRGLIAIDQASVVFGSREAAEAWLGQPETGLDGRRPIDLLQTEAGAQFVHDFLRHPDHGVY